MAGDGYTTAGIDFHSTCGMMVERIFPEMEVAKRYPRLVAWREAMNARPMVRRVLAGEDRTAPGLHTWTGHAK